MLKYISELKALTKGQPGPNEKQDAVNLLVKRMGKYYPERSHLVVHASDVTKKDFCARQYRLMDITGTVRPERYLSAALRATFDMGNDVASRICNDWLGEDAIGHWKCQTCGDEKTFSTRPGKGCIKLQPCNWRYQEVKFIHAASQISGSLDLMLDLGGTKATVIELKITKGEDFESLVAPMGEHRVRTALYLRLIDESNSPLKGLIDTKHAKIIYVSRGHGKKNLNVGQIVPFKEYDVERDDAATQPYIEMGQEVYEARKNHVIPINKVCSAITCFTAKSCPVKSACFSGEYP